ncbi:PEGA domain-containing protein, partial [Salinispira pacifica]
PAAVVLLPQKFVSPPEQGAANAGGARNSMIVLISDQPERSGGARPQSDVVRFDGPTPFDWSINDRGWKFRTRTVAPGTYRFVSRTVKYSNGRTAEFRTFDPGTFTVPPAAVVLLPQKFVSPPEQGAANAGGASSSVMPTPEGVEQVGPSDQRHLADLLSNDVRIAEWGGRTAYGFGPYSPFPDIAHERVAVNITSDPPGSRLTIDDQVWGETPVQVDLTEGRHFLRLDHKGYDPHTEFIDVGRSGGTRSYALEQSKTEEPAGPVDLVLGGFANLGSAQNDYLTEVFRQSLQLGLTRAGLKLTDPPESSGPGGGKPDFAYAEKIGAPMVVAGDYHVTGEEMIVHAVLYDTRSRLVRASTLFDERTGLSVFEAIDAMTADFVASVKKALPNIGKSVVQEPVLSPQQLEFMVRVNKQAVVRAREERPYVLSLGAAQQATFDQVSDSTGDSNSRTNGPGIGVRAALDLPLSGPLSLSIAAAPTIYPRYEYGPQWDLPLYVGPVFTYRTYRNDVYIGLVESFHFVPRSYVRVNDVYFQAGPFWMTGLCVDTGARFYTYGKLSDIPRFWGFGFTLGLYGVRFDWDITHPVAYHPEIALYVVWGTHL